MKLDPKAEIQRAYEWAANTQESKYVAHGPTSFKAVAKQPPASMSHWMVQPDGELFAHVDTNSNGVYSYEKV